MDRLVKLCARSWTLKALVLIAGGVPARISPVAHAAGCGRTAMTASFETLLALGLLVRASGHGHPLRPEFSFSPQGRSVAEWALVLDGYLDGDDDWQRVRRSWTLPLLSLLTVERRFGALRRALSPVSDRSLSLALAELTEYGWIERRVDGSSTPPSVRYAATARVRCLVEHLDTFPTGEA